MKKSYKIKQLKFIKKSISYIGSVKKKDIDISTSPLCFITTWAEMPGKQFVDLFLNKKLNLFFNIKNYLSISKNFDLKSFYSENLKLNKKKKIILSYCSKKNFTKDGSYIDNFFDTGKSYEKYIWILISLDNYVPDKIRSNLFIIAKQKTNSFSLFHLTTFFFQRLIHSKLNPKFFFHTFWFEYDFAISIAKIINNFFDFANIKKVLINYEGIPFQNHILNSIKRKNSNIQTIGYLHCAPWPIQTDLIYKNSSLDILYVSGSEQKKVLNKFFCWDKKKIKVIPSLRFKKKKQKEFQGFIFVPYNLAESNDYLLRLEEFLSKNRYKLGNLKVRIHPLNLNSNVHLLFKKKTENLIKRYKNKFNLKIKNISIFFGSITGVAVQALEEGCEIIHFPDNELEIFSKKIWNNIEVDFIEDRVVSYKIKSYNKLFFTSFENNKFRKYLKF